VTAVANSTLAGTRRENRGGSMRSDEEGGEVEEEGGLGRGDVGETRLC